MYTTNEVKNMAKAELIEIARKQAKRDKEHPEKKCLGQYKPKRGIVGRNMPCPCGSGKKYKHCCLPKEGTCV